MQVTFGKVGDFIAHWWGAALAALVVAGGLLYMLFGMGSALGATLTIAPANVSSIVSVTGSVTAAKDVTLGFAANGRVSGVYASVGQHVAAGTLLVEVENGDLAASLAEQQANLAALIAGTRPEQLAVDEATVAGDQSALADAIRTAYTTADDAVHNKTDSLFNNPRTNPTLAIVVSNSVLITQVEAERAALEPLLATWSTSLASLTSATAAADAPGAARNLAQVSNYLADLNAAVNQASGNQSAAETTIATTRAAEDTAATALSSATAALSASEKSLTLAEAGPTQADLDAAKAAVDAAAAAFAKTEVYAPFAGTVTRMDAKVGEIVSPSTADIAMQSDGIFQIDAYVPEVSIAGVAVGDAATTTLDAYGANVVFPAKVIAVDPAETINNGVPTYKTTLSFLSNDPRIKSGMTANVSIETGTLSDAIVIPAGAVGNANSAPYVSRVVDDRAVSQPVTLGATPSLGMVQITSGLAKGDVILLTPQ